LLFLSTRDGVLVAPGVRPVASPYTESFDPDFGSVPLKIKSLTVESELLNPLLRLDIIAAEREGVSVCRILEIAVGGGGRSSVGSNDLISVETDIVEGEIINFFA
jgi:hypothetical protein